MTNILTVPMGANDANAATVGEYLTKLLADVWRYDEGFDGKRPFGNSGWKWEVYAALAAAGLDETNADTSIYAAIANMGGAA